MADCPAIARVHVQSWRESFSGIVPQVFLDKMSVEKRTRAFEQGFSAALYKMYVAETPDYGIVGFADFGEPREKVNGYEGELYAIYLLPEFQRRGIGRRLFQLGADYLSKTGKRSMYLMTLEISPYRAFYEKLGGRIIGKMPVEIEGIRYDELIYGWDDLDLIGTRP